MHYEGLSVPITRSGVNKKILMQLARHDYEVPEIRGLRKAVRKGDRVLELGTGLGIITALVAQAAGASGTILSFEANPDLIPDTRDFLESHGIANVEIRHAVVVPKAASDEKRAFLLAESFPTSSLLGAAEAGSEKTISVPVQKLDAVMEELKPDVLICDIEGAEAELIPELDASGLRAAVIELHPDRLTAEQLDAIDSALQRHGLRQDPEPLGGTVVLYTRPDI